MKFIHLLPLGNTDRGLVKELIPCLWEAFRVPVDVRECTIELDQFYDGSRNQYNSTKILLHLKQHWPLSVHQRPGGSPTDGKLLAIVPHDLFIPILTFVFGEAELDGNVAVVSYHRLENERYGLPRNNAVLIQRLQKEALHELGHVHGLVHCSSTDCVMRTSTSIDEVDLKSARFCDACSGHLEKSPH